MLRYYSTIVAGVSLFVLAATSHGADYESVRFPESAVNTEKASRQAQVARQKVAARLESHEKLQQGRGVKHARDFGTESQAFKNGSARKIKKN